MVVSILGLDINDRNTSAALVIDGAVVAAVQEERLNREKQTRKFPLQAMNWCLRQAGLPLSSIDAVAVSVNPAIYLETLAPAQSERARFRGELLYAPANYLLGALGAHSTGMPELSLPNSLHSRLKIHYITHHDCHAALAYYLCPWDSAAVLSIDGFGEKETTVTYRAAGTALERLEGIEFPHSVGCFYAAMTEYLGLRPFRDEWKLMAAAAHGDPAALGEKVGRLLHTGDNGGFEVDLSYFDYPQFHRPGLFSAKLVRLLGQPYAPGAEADRRYFDIAAATQLVTETAVFALLRALHRQTGGNRLCLTGGVAMNCVLNGKIAAHTPFRELYVPAAPDDSGTSLGAALHVYYNKFGSLRTVPPAHNAFGPAFTDAEIEAELQRNRLSYSRLDSAAEVAAREIASGKLVGWFQGGVEFGERALGQRSILADPRDSSAPAKLAAAVKERPLWQPFAPSILAEKAADWFADPSPSPYMDRALTVRDDRRASVPAVVAADGTARVQTVTQAQNPLYHSLLQAFERQTGVPLVLNTSFNLDGEPIVCTPRDAVRTFFSSGLDTLIVGPFRVTK